MTPLRKTYTVLKVELIMLGTAQVTANAEGYQMHQSTNPETLTYRTAVADAPQVGDVLTVDIEVKT